MSTDVKLTLITFILVTLNILFAGSIFNVIVFIPQVIYILDLLCKKKLENALYWHIVFIITSLNPTVSGALVDGQNVAFYNYASFKLIGPISMSYLITIMFAIIGMRTHKKSKYYKNELIIFRKSIRIFIYFGCSGTILGFIGFVFDYYRIGSFVSYNIYIWMTVLLMYALDKLGSPDLTLKVYNSAVPIISGAIFASAFVFFILGITTSYGGLHDLPQMAELTYFTSLLILGILFYKKSAIILLATIIYFLLASKYIIGKQIIIIAISLIVLAYQILFNKSYLKVYRKRSHFLRIFVIVGAVLLISSSVLSNSSSLTYHKLYQVSSLFSLAESQSSDDVTPSAATRIAETANFIDNNKNNIFSLVFGKGYGGYITDSLGLFIGHDFEGGGFSDDQIKSGRYSQLHDTFATVPLLNGFLGLFLLLYLVYLYLKRFKYNYLTFTVVPWLIFTFYFNTQYSFTGIFFLYGSLVNNDYYKKL